MKQISLTISQTSNVFLFFGGVEFETYLIPGTSQDFGREDSMGNWSTQRQKNQSTTANDTENTIILIR